MGQDRYSGYPVTFSNGTPWHLQQISGTRLRLQQGLDEIQPMGLADLNSVIMVAADPSVEFDTEDLTTFFTNVSATAGYNASAGSTLRYQIRADGGTFVAAASTAHAVLTSTKGFLFPVSLSASQDAAAGAVLTAEYRVLWDGTTSGGLPVSPLAVSVASAISATTPIFNSKFFMGPVYLGSTQLEGIERWTINFGIDFRNIRADGELYPRVGSIYGRRASVTIEGKKLSDLTTAQLMNASPGATLSVFAVKGALGGHRVATTTAQHFKFAVTSGAWRVGNVSASRNDDAMQSIVFNATSTPTFSVASTIP